MRYTIERVKKSDYLPRPFPGNFMQAQQAERQWESAKRTPFNAIAFTAFTRSDLGSYATRKEAQAACDHHEQLGAAQ